MTTINETKKNISIGAAHVKKSFMTFLAYYGILCFWTGHKWEDKMGANGQPYENFA